MGSEDSHASIIFIVATLASLLNIRSAGGARVSSEMGKLIEEVGTRESKS